MHHRRLVPLLAAVAFAGPASAPAAAQAPRASVVAGPSAAVLAGITARGRALARFQELASGASRVLQSMRPDTALVRQYVVRESAAGWSVHFGRLDAARDTFYEAYVVSAGPKDSSVVVRAREAGAAAAAVDRAAAAAGRLAQETFGAGARPYNTFVIPADAGEWWAYLLPAQTVAGIYPHGGDVRYRVSADGRRILATRRMHASIADVQVGDGVLAHAHGPSAGDVPEDSDVYWVLTRRPRVPELLETPRRDYRVEVDGTIRSLPHAKAGTAGDGAGRG